MRRWRNDPSAAFRRSPRGRAAGADGRDSRALVQASDHLSGREGPAFPPAVVILSPPTDPSGDGKDLLSRVVPEQLQTLRPSGDGERAASIGKMKKQGRAVLRLSGRSQGLAPGLSNAGHTLTFRSPKPRHAESVLDLERAAAFRTWVAGTPESSPPARLQPREFRDAPATTIEPSATSGLDGPSWLRAGGGNALSHVGARPCCSTNKSSLLGCEYQFPSRCTLQVICVPHGAHDAGG